MRDLGRKDIKLFDIKNAIISLKYSQLNENYCNYREYVGKFFLKVLNPKTTEYGLLSFQLRMQEV